MPVLDGLWRLGGCERVLMASPTSGNLVRPLLEDAGAHQVAEVDGSGRLCEVRVSGELVGAVGERPGELHRHSLAVDLVVGIE